MSAVKLRLRLEGGEENEKRKSKDMNEIEFIDNITEEQIDWSFQAILRRRNLYN